MKPFVIDCGAHLGQDCQRYLAAGYRVLAVDASPSMCDHLERIFKQDVEEGNLSVLRIAVTKVRGDITFYESKESLWNSARREIADRWGYLLREIEVCSSPLMDIILSEGIKPLYVKIDLEGCDYDAVMSLEGINPDLLPTYISCETECLGVGESLTEDEATKTLDALFEIGYRKFKLVDQASLSPVTLANYSALRYPVAAEKNPSGATGPFGENVPAPWMDYASAKYLLLTFREWFFRSNPSYSYQFWSDWHAARWGGGFGAFSSLTHGWPLLELMAS